MSSQPERPRASTRFVRRTFLGSLLIAAFGFLVVAMVRLAIVFPWHPEDLVVGDAPVAADAIVVLEGAIHRVDHALDLIEAGYAATLIYPGAYPWAEQQLAIRSEERAIDYELLIRRNGRSTFNEAVNTREILVDHPELTSILLVTSDYHSYRSEWIFRKVLPRTVAISSSPSRNSRWLPERATTHGSWHAHIFREEQVKFLYYFFAYGWRRYP